MSREQIYESKKDKERQRDAMMRICMVLDHLVFEPNERRNNKYPKCDFVLKRKDNGLIVANAEVKGCKYEYGKFDSVPLALRKAKSLQDQQLYGHIKSLIVFAYNDKIAYIWLDNLEGKCEWVERKNKRPNNVFDKELVITIPLSNLEVLDENKL